VKEVGFMERDGRLLRIEDVQELLGISRWKAYEMVRRGELPVLRIGRLVRVPRSALEAWIETKTGGAREAA
jgi:putative molybdopterin biosynthesis protein